MYTQDQAIRAARRLLRNGGIRSICLDRLKDYPQVLNRDKFHDLVFELVDDTFYWEM